MVGAQFYLELKCRKKKASHLSAFESFFIKPAKLGFFDLQARWVFVVFSSLSSSALIKQWEKMANIFGVYPYVYIYMDILFIKEERSYALLV